MTEKRRTLSGISGVLRTDAPWRDMPEGYGNWKDAVFETMASLGLSADKEHAIEFVVEMRPCEVRARHEKREHGAFTKVLLHALTPDDIDTDCNGVITMADLTVTMTTTRRRPLSQEEMEARVELRVRELEVLAARTAVEYGRERLAQRLERLAQRLLELGIPPPTK